MVIICSLTRSAQVEVRRNADDFSEQCSWNKSSLFLSQYNEISGALRNVTQAGCERCCPPPCTEMRPKQCGLVKKGMAVLRRASPWSYFHRDSVAQRPSVISVNEACSREVVDHCSREHSRVCSGGADVLRSMSLFIVSHQELSWSTSTTHNHWELVNHGNEEGHHLFGWFFSFFRHLNPKLSFLQTRKVI